MAAKDKTLLTLLVFAALNSIICVPLPRCLFSRLDYVPCQYRNKALQFAGQNQYSIHHTRLRLSASGLIECHVRPRGQIIRDITTVGNDNLKVLHSPGIPYDNQLLVQYNVRCEEDQLMFLNLTHLDIQGADCDDGEGNKKCEDYIQINRGSFGAKEICGNNTPSSSLSQLQSSSANIIFRTSEEVQGVGFEMQVICFRETDRDLPGCTSPSNFSQSVCNTSGSTCQDVSEVFEALKSYEDCNPVLRSRARALLQYYKDNGYINIEKIMKFGITCDYGEVLHCDVDDGFAPALQGLTTCQINDQEPVACDPFYSSVPLNISSSVVTNKIIVKAINCNGQRAESEVSVTV